MIEEVKKIFDDIRDGIIEMGGDIDMCTSPEEYAEAIKGLSGNNAVLFIPCFKASETKPETPVKTMSPADPTDYPDGWGTPDGLTGKIWMTYTIVSVSTVYVPWTEPVLLGAAGESPTPPVYEPQVTRTFLICMELPEAEITPNIPTGGKWDVDNNVLLGTIEYPSAQYTIESLLSNGNTAGWSCNNNHVSGGYTWMSVGTFLAENGSQVGSWSDPMCINSARDGKDGQDGRNGVDGTDVEFIYMLCTKAEATSIPAPPSDPDRDDDVPITGHVPDWTDQPSSIDPDNYPVEIMCQRKKNKETGKWGPFVGPVVWASWGEDGMDGDGVEYIFRVATNAEVTQDANGKYHLNDIATWPPTCGDDCANAFYTVAAGHGYTREELTEIYQQDDWVPGDNASTIGWDRNWTDDPFDVDVNKPFEFVSIRKYDGETGTWGWFSAPVLWNKYYVTSAPIFTSYAFCRSTKNLGNMTLSGGTVINPLPNDQTVDGELIHWYDTVPGAAEYGAESTRAKAPIWMTSSKFGSVDPTVVISPNWSSPALMADSKYFNVEYSASDTFTTPLPKFDAYLPGVVSGKDYPFINNANSEGVDEETWRSYCISHGHGTWGDTVTNPKWMATCTFENGLWSDWTVTQIKGEDGTDGQDGQDGQDGADGRGIVSIVYSYMWSNDGTNHPSASDPGWSSSIPANPNNYTYLWRKTVTTYSSGTTTETTYEIISKTGQRGPIGPKMRMRNWSESYTAPDGEGMSGWLSGDGASDAFYDIAIYPPASEGINVTNTASNADHLYRCTQSITYAEIADLVTTYGVGNVHPGSGGHLDSYFTRAVGWDFVATKLLLADRINANQIDVAGLSTDTLVTTEETDDPQSYIHAQGNTFTLFKTGNPSCIITADDLTANTNTNARTVWKSPLGVILDTNSEAGVTFTKQLGEFKIFNANNQNDEIYSTFPQFFGIRLTGTVKNDVPIFGFNHEDSAAMSNLIINIINKETGAVQTWNQEGYFQTKYFVEEGSTRSYWSGETVDVQWTGFEIDTSQCHYKTLDPGWYSMELTGTIFSVAATTFLQKCDNYRMQIVQYGESVDPSQTSAGSCVWNEYPFWYGYHSPIVIHHTDISVNHQTTEIAANGFGHVLDVNNYFLLKHPKITTTDPDTQEQIEIDDPDTLMLEFLANGLYGIQISRNGIKYTKTGAEHWTDLV